MKVLIGYDGSESSMATLEELKRAGLPAETKILIVTVGDVWMPATDISNLPSAVHTSRRVASTVAQMQNQAEQKLTEMKEISGAGAAQVKSDFPDWQVETETMSGDAALAIIRKADEWQADLIIVGSQNRSTVGRFFLGSVSRKVVEEAKCSVRVARGAVETDKNAPRRIVVGIANSESDDLIIKEIARREWARETVVMLVSATDTFNENSVQPFQQIIGAQEFQKEAREILAASGLKVLLTVKEGDAKTILLNEAEVLSADCIFVGSRGIKGILNRILLGSVSSAIVTNAPCPVEVVRSAAR